MADRGELDDVRKAALGCSIQDFIAGVWREAEKSSGSQAGAFYREDGVFSIEKLVLAEGREAIGELSKFRAGIGAGVRVSRHVMSNYSFRFDRLADEGMVDVVAVMTHFGATGQIPLPLEGPIGLYDVAMAIERQADGGWLIARLHMTPTFLVRDHPVFSVPKTLSAPAAPPG